MTAEEKTEIIKQIVAKMKAAGLKIQGNYITIEEMVVSPEFAKVMWGSEPICNVCGSDKRELLAVSYEACPDHGMEWNVNIPSWRYHQHQLLDFIQSYNMDEMLRYIASFL